MHARKQTHTLVQLQETFWSCFHPDCPSLCLLVYVRIYVHVLKRQKKGSWENQIILLQSPMGWQSQGISGSLLQAYSPGTQVCVCVCWYACVWQRDGKRTKRCAGSGNLWTPTHSQFYLHPEYDIQNFTRKSRGREDKKMANSSQINKSPSTNIKQLL